MLLFGATVVCAQEEQVRYGIRAGNNLSCFIGSGTRQNSKYLNGLSAGVTIDIRFGRLFMLMTGLDFLQKGQKTDILEYGDYDNIIGSEKSQLNYVQIPARIAIRTKIQTFDNNNMYLRIFAGPYFAVGIAGKTTSILNDVKYKYDSFSGNMFKRCDYGIGFGAGIDSGYITIDAGFELGLARISNRADVKNLRNATLYATLGCKF